MFLPRQENNWFSFIPQPSLLWPSGLQGGIRLAEDRPLEIDQSTNMTKFTSFTSQQSLSAWATVICCCGFLKCGKNFHHASWIVWSLIVSYSLSINVETVLCKKAMCNTCQKFAQVQQWHFLNITCCEELAGWIAFTLVMTLHISRTETLTIPIFTHACLRDIYVLPTNTPICLLLPSLVPPYSTQHATCPPRPLCDL
jgi:hypothetical protein